MRDHGKMRIENPDTLFFTADLHFWHENAIGLCDRPFRDISQMNETLIHNWNAAVSDEATVFVLGDMFWKEGFREKYEAIMRRLSGKKHLVAGNHDYFSRGDYLEMGFEDAWDYLELVIGKRKVICSHYPMLEWNGFYRGNWHLHGHTHGRGSHFSARVMDVGVDANDFMPVPWRKIESELEEGWDLDQAMMKERGDTTRHCPYTFQRKLWPAK